jgi:hypothetical protein
MEETKSREARPSLPAGAWRCQSAVNSWPADKNGLTIVVAGGRRRHATGGGF